MYVHVCTKTIIKALFKVDTYESKKYQLRIGPEKPRGLKTSLTGIVGLFQAHSFYLYLVSSVGPIVSSLTLLGQDNLV